MVSSAVWPGPRSRSYWTKATPLTLPEALNTWTPWRRALMETLTAEKVKVVGLETQTFCSKRLDWGLNCGVVEVKGRQSITVTLTGLESAVASWSSVARAVN